MVQPIVTGPTLLNKVNIQVDEDQKRLINQLTLHEGRRTKPYTCTAGKLTIGVGRNLTDRGLSEDEIDYLLVNDIILVEEGLDSTLPWWRTLDTVRQRVLIDMVLNLGITRFLKFKNTIKFIKEGEYKDASENMLKSLWAKQVGKRANRLAQMMLTGKDYTQ